MTVFGQAVRKTCAPYAIAALIAFASVAGAVQPDEVLEDPALEARARDISAGLRCLVCQNESIDESNASLARDLRLLVRERLLAGDTDKEVVAFIVDRYGEFVLLRPTTGGWNWLLWASGPGLFVLALGLGVAYVRRRSAAGTGEADTGLSVDEQKRLDELLKGDGQGG
ncbi:cytochrome c-type biogenesis protein [Mameliella sediminis]|uniref:cytochrome c-type biogenesis protein n=1 Tax=Mameliella sediminis TaxID=2836866 RepID=UPI001C43F51B|nr:cytochrome c-type biogenesis protein [Mameliella sediminis]MBY6114747.1 cytochrome c-type biogenesis protein CcmH [Antarctobacter heliothermus]MBY6144320.1 cytochrome c-type biogenesis protein CcmH [Mameliella alba]MBV7392772.1 cytochrome c-type biogenesis protein CcmH [Mameliella sediminis]MBY6161389.1 cytochrome c-type biogenesis protein CcmH [Mameliella alba]MBY6170145.1 cytochrome c-type biogenesis protein CcmH [Mameliella alba]